MNFIGAALILTLDDEELAFWVFLYLMTEVLPPRYYANDLIDCQVDQKVIERLLRKEANEVAVKLSDESISLPIICIPWIMCSYLNSLPFEVGTTFVNR